MRITLVHALKHSIVPIEASFAKLWPDVQLMNLLDDSLSADLARDGKLTDAMTERFLSIGRYAASTGTDGILFTCSAFGPCIEAVAGERVDAVALADVDPRTRRLPAHGSRLLRPTTAARHRELDRAATCYLRRAFLPIGPSSRFLHL